MVSYEIPSVLKHFRANVERARTSGKRFDIVTFAWARPLEDIPVVTIAGLDSEMVLRGDVDSALKQLFIEQTGSRMSLTRLINAAYKHPQSMTRESHIDVRHQVVLGARSIQLGVDIGLDDSRELFRTFYVKGPWVGERIRQSINARMRYSRSALPPDGEF